MEILRNLVNTIFLMPFTKATLRLPN